jgi:hypothetical protein
MRMNVLENVDCFLIETLTIVNQQKGRPKRRSTLHGKNKRVLATKEAKQASNRLPSDGPR